MKVLKDIFSAVFILCIVGALLGTAIWMYSSFFLSSDKLDAEYYVLEKQSEKGLFLGPRYSVITDNDNGSNFVSKKVFDSLEFGDIIHGHGTDEYGFFTKMDQIYDGSLLILLIIILGFMFIFLLYGCIVSIPAVERKLKKLEMYRTKKKKRNRLGTSILLVILPLALAYSSLYSLNLFYKVVPVGQTFVEGHIIDREFDWNFTPKADYSTYELTIVFTAEDGETYQVKKGVTRATYHNYEYKSSIGLKYRNNNPYDIFIEADSIKEIIGTIANVYTVLYVLCLVTFYLLCRHYKEERRIKVERK